MGPPPHPALQRLIDICGADTSFALDELSRLAQFAPSSPLAGHLDLDHVGIAGGTVGSFLRLPLAPVCGFSLGRLGR